MLRSLVGSEMCIRDRHGGTLSPHAQTFKVFRMHNRTVNSCEVTLLLAAYLHCNLQDHCSVAACDTDASELLSRLVGCKKNHFVENQIFNLPLKLCNILTVFLWPPYVIGGPLYFCPVVSFYLLLLSSFFSSPNLSGRRLDVYHTLAHGVALVRV